MKTIDREHHLTRDELLKAVVDTAELPGERQAHLAQCAGCQRALQSLENDLMQIGRRAQVLASEPARGFRLPDKQPGAAGRRSVPLLAMGAIAAILLVVAVWGPTWFFAKGPSQVASREAVADSELMADVDALVDNALPLPYKALAYVASPTLEGEADFNEDLTDWVVPPVEYDDTLS
jgi:hypothetical protein